MASDLITVLAEGTFEDQIVETSAFLSRSLPESERNDFISNFQSISAEADTKEGQEAQIQKAEVVKKLVQQVKSIGEGSDRELEGVFNLISTLILQTIPESQEGARAELIGQITSALTKQEGVVGEKSVVRYRILSNIFNTLPPRSPLRLELFLSLLSLASANDDLHYISSAINSLPQWLAEWNISPASKSDCLEKVSKALQGAEKEHDQGSKAYEYLLLHLRYISNEPSLLESSSANNSTAAERVLATALRLPKVFEFEELLQIKAVTQLEGNPIFELVKIFVGGSIADFSNWSAKAESKEAINRLGLDEAELERKIKLLELASLCARSVSTEVPYAEIQKLLGIQEDDVETWVIDVVRAGLVSGKLSQVNQSFRVYRSIQRVFGEEQWKSLEKRLEQWRSSVSNILEVIDHSRSGNSSQQVSEQVVA
ncbi:PCI-domain-containing protein [Violaceomyces palustris]|uniref:PCI-domain-containing protein n=1 Tax=Violaceomyces palustris TaxID=1673888 RepID=A0ACD0NWP9_9BASI|nr:PCI-domain-containing protein [Violaceomyces palustris]